MIKTQGIRQLHLEELIAEKKAINKELDGIETQLRELGDNRRRLMQTTLRLTQEIRELEKLQRD